MSASPSSVAIMNAFSIDMYRRDLKCARIIAVVSILMGTTIGLAAVAVGIVEIDDACQTDTPLELSTWLVVLGVLHLVMTLCTIKAFAVLQHFDDGITRRRETILFFWTVRTYRVIHLCWAILGIITFSLGQGRDCVATGTVLGVTSLIVLVIPIPLPRMRDVFVIVHALQST